MTNIRSFITKVFTLAVVALALSSCGSTEGPQVETQYGPVKGIAEDGLIIFRGIPYAAPPVADLRWQAPQPHQGWQEPLLANEFGPACWQDNSSGNVDFLRTMTEGSGMGGFTTWMLTTFGDMFTPAVSEDCLALHIIAPEKGEQPYPVMFWIHGGGHQFGSGGGPYESQGLANKGVVLVSINYRLGLYGFLAHPELAEEDPNGSTGNYGMLDQIAALQWVQDNIAAFGGDPNRVTIFGESAGGHSVGQLMASPLAKGLFHRAVAQSGTGFYQFQATDKIYERMSGFDAGRLLAQKAGVAGDNEIAALRNLSVDELAPFAINPELSSTFHPQIDGYVLPNATAHQFANGEQAPIPLIVGSNADEGTLLYPFGLPPVDGGATVDPRTLDAWDNLLKEEFGENASAIAQLYPVDQNQDVYGAAMALMGDTWFGRHAYYMAQDHAAAGHPTYLYFYERHPPSENQTLGASHALELNHVFDGLLPGWPSDERDTELRSQMQGYWTNLAKTGNPNNKHLPAWQPFDTINTVEMALGHEQTYVRPVARKDRYDLMHAQFKRRMAAVPSPQM